MVAQGTSQNFIPLVLESRVPVLVDFHAKWCGPCRLQSPILDELQSDAQGRFQVAKIDADEEPSLAQKYGVSALPTLLVFHEGEVVQRLVGLQSKDALLRALSVAV